MKLQLVLALTLCLTSVASAQKDPLCVVDGRVQGPCSALGAGKAPPPLCIVDGVRQPSGSCQRDWTREATIVIPGSPVTALGGKVTGYRLEAADIVSVEVIKGAAATAQYGAEAANGVIVIATNRGAQAVPPGAVPPADDPLGRFLFPPELVMAHQQEIGLTDRQRQAIQSAMKEAQGKFIDLQFSMSGEVEKLQHLVQATAPDEAKVMEQLDRVLAGERDVKHAQLTLMVRIKDQLTEQQQAMLAKLR